MHWSKIIAQIACGAEPEAHKWGCNFENCTVSRMQDGKMLKVCARCGLKRYCCKEHQVADYPRHKKECKAIVKIDHNPSEYFNKWVDLNCWKCALDFFHKDANTENGIRKMKSITAFVHDIFVQSPQKFQDLTLKEREKLMILGILCASLQHDRELILGAEETDKVARILWNVLDRATINDNVLYTSVVCAFVQICCAHNKPEDAETWLRKVDRQVRGDLEIRHLLLPSRAFVALSRDQKEKAEQYASDISSATLETAAEDSDQSTQWQIQALLDACEIYEHTGNHDKVVLSAKQALRLCETDPSTLDCALYLATKFATSSKCSCDDSGCAVSELKAMLLANLN